MLCPRQDAKRPTRNMSRLTKKRLFFFVLYYFVHDYFVHKLVSTAVTKFRTETKS